MISTALWHYRASIGFAYDGDTMHDVVIDIGLHHRYEPPHGIRLLGLDTPEIRTKDLAEKIRGLAAKEFSTLWLNEHRSHLGGDVSLRFPFALYCKKSDSFTRPLVFLECGLGHCLNDDLIVAGHAVAWE